MRNAVILLAVVAVAAGAGCATQPEPPPFKAAASTLELMEGPMAHAAEVYWGSVSTIVDKDGIHENFPRNDEEWEAVWAAGLSIAESGNLLMMDGRSREGEWNTFAARLVDVGLVAANAAEAKNPEGVLEQGEQVYNVCTACHNAYIMEE